jgi:hypothetical protein
VSATVATVLIARGVIAGVLAVSATFKLRARAETLALFRAARVPDSLALTLALVEGFTALGLLVEQRTAWAAFVACGLIAAFTVFVVVRVSQGDHAPCPCFGATSAAPMGGRTIARNIVLLAVAVLGTGRATHDHWISLVVAIVIAVSIVSATYWRAARPPRAPRPPRTWSSARRQG